MSDDMGRDPSDVELADKTGISQGRIKKLRKMVLPSVTESVFEPDADRDATLPGTVLANKLDTAEEMVYDSLSPRDKAIYDFKTGKHGRAMLSNQAIAKRLGVTPALISQRSKQIADQIVDVQHRGLA
jgi:DNA-directed RNA polymerase specialized sigma subunit